MDLPGVIRVEENGAGVVIVCKDVESVVHLNACGSRYGIAETYAGKEASYRVEAQEDAVDGPVSAGDGGIGTGEPS